MPDLSSEYPSPIFHKRKTGMLKIKGRTIPEMQGSHSDHTLPAVHTRSLLHESGWETAQSKCLWEKSKHFRKSYLSRWGDEFPMMMSNLYVPHSATLQTHVSRGWYDKRYLGRMELVDWFHRTGKPPSECMLSNRRRVSQAATKGHGHISMPTQLLRCQRLSDWTLLKEKVWLSLA